MKAGEVQSLVTACNRRTTDFRPETLDGSSASGDAKRVARACGDSNPASYWLKTQCFDILDKQPAIGCA
jgi:hypothetical protein